MRLKFLTTAIIIALIAFLLGPQTGQTQQPRGGGSRGGRGPGAGGGAFDPSRLFEMMARGGNTIKISEMRMGGDRAAEWARNNNITNGELTKEQFAEYAKTLSGGRTGSPAPASATDPAAPDASPPAPSGDIRGGSGGPGGGFKGGFGGGRGGDPNRFADESFRRMDKNQDGFLDYEEMSENLKAEKDKWDADMDGLIDINEYREYIKAWQEKNRADRGESPGPGDADGARSDDRRGSLPPGSSGDEHPSFDLDKKVVVLRAGKLGDKMPAWFTEYDLDKDAQVALYEWKEKGGDLSEFRKWDLNGDGFITPDEVMRVNAVASKEAATSSSSSAGDSRTASVGGAPRPGTAGAAGAAGAANWFSKMFAGRGRQGGAPASGAPGSGIGGGNAADSMFDLFAKGRSTFNISEAGQMRGSLSAYAEKKGLSDGVITKEQFRDYWAQREAERGQAGPGSRGNRGGGKQR